MFHMCEFGEAVFEDPLWDERFANGYIGFPLGFRMICNIFQLSALSRLRSTSIAFEYMFRISIGIFGSRIF